MPSWFKNYFKKAKSRDEQEEIKKDLLTVDNLIGPIPEKTQQTLSGAIDRIPCSDQFKEKVKNYFYTENKQNGDAEVTSADTYICYIASYIHIYFIKREDNNKFLQLLCNLIISQQNKTPQTIPYDFITYLIYQVFVTEEITDNDESRQERGSYVQLAIEGLEGSCSNDDREVLRGIFGKLDRHILLAIHQRKYISASIFAISDDLRNIKEESALLKKEAKELDRNIKLSNSKADSFLDKLQSVTGTYVAILGIFATIIVSIMGGISLFDGAAKYINNKTEYLFYISSGLFSLLIVVYFSYTWVERLRREVRASDSNEWFYVVLSALFITAVITWIVSANSSTKKMTDSTTTVQERSNHDILIRIPSDK